MGRGWTPPASGVVDVGGAVLPPVFRGGGALWWLLWGLWALCRGRVVGWQGWRRGRFSGRPAGPVRRVGRWRRSLSLMGWRGGSDRALAVDRVGGWASLLAALGAAVTASGAGACRGSVQLRGGCDGLVAGFEGQ